MCFGGLGRRFGLGLRVGGTPVSHLVVPGDMDMGTGVDMGIGVRGAMLTGVGGGRGGDL